MKAVDSSQAQRIVQRDLNLHRLTVQDLILSAALNLEDRVLAHPGARVVFLCGEGLKGECGQVAAHLLRQDSTRQTTVALGRPKQSRYRPLLEHDGAELCSVSRQVREALRQADIIVDAVAAGKEEPAVLFPYDRWIQWANQSGAFRISLDVPSGVDADNGAADGTAFSADETCVLQIPKLGLYLYPGSGCAGKLVIEPVGLSWDAVSSVDSGLNVLEESQVREMIPRRRSHSHKGTYGKVLLIAGSDGTTGAAVLAGKAILKTGAGLLTILSYPETLNALRTNLPEAMTRTLDAKDVKRSIQALDLSRFSLIVIGPGLGVNADTVELLKAVLATDRPVIVDADGLTGLSQCVGLLARPYLTILTPHIGEYGRLFDPEPHTLPQHLRELTGTIYPHTVIVLKGDRTLISHDGRLEINAIGNNALAKGGSGDVLTGVIGGFAAQQPGWQAAAAGVYVHAKAADDWVKHNSHYSLLASDLIEEIDNVLCAMVPE